MVVRSSLTRASDHYILRMFFFLSFSHHTFSDVGNSHPRNFPIQRGLVPNRTFAIPNHKLPHRHVLSQLEAGHSVECITHAGHLIAFLHFLTLRLWPLSFWPLLGEILWRTIPVLSLAILVSAVLVLSCGQTDRIAHADGRYTHATTVGVSNYLKIT